MPPGLTHPVPCDSEDLPLPSIRGAELSPPGLSNAINLSTALLNLFGRGALSFWQWTASNNELTTFGALGADSLEDWMTRIHPRDQADFSAFIDQLGEREVRDTSIEYRFAACRHGDWIRIRQTAHSPDPGDFQKADTLICLIEKLASQGTRTTIAAIDAIKGQFRSGAAQAGNPSADAFFGFVGAEAFSAALPVSASGSEPDNDAQESGRTESIPTGPQGTATAATSEKRALEEKRLKGSTILLVEDEAAVRKLVRKLLEMLGCSVIESTSGRQALSLWPEIRDRVSLVVSDIVMPGGISGWDLARELHHRHPALPILLTSGYSEFAEDHDLINHPRIAFLQKPYQIKSLRNTLCRLTRETVSCCAK